MSSSSRFGRAPALARGVVLRLLAGLFMLAGTASLAHEQKAAVTRVLFNPRTHNIEVMHRFLLHDAEHAASVIFGTEQRLLESEESRELFSSYVMNRFAIEAVYANGDSALLALKYIGVELDGQYLWVYQEIGDDPAIRALKIVNSALRDVWPEQLNLVNIEREGQIHTLTFSEAADVLVVNL